MRILIVDDDRVCSVMLTAMLARFGRCSVASDGETAVRLFTEGMVSGERFDLVCLDIMMPGLDGHATLCVLRAIEAAYGLAGLDGVTIFMATQASDARNVMTAFRGQCDGYLVKPIQETQLLEQMAEQGFKPLAGDRGSA